ncbi:DUF979 domain-containing protein [Ruoffia tabacinasalis]|uniref:DUF979 domain-containing protein n=1 Tax=Ruoffia tabacinasalis TaxID=87458 RepID=A0ABS0LIL5_9LACT|nr:DUF979 domain-containing protein [Ruoffia tabacinasalis]MBG9978133.1 DUF979 domain-containing protein [Ruoffia tabacinasalis]
MEQFASTVLEIMYIVIGLQLLYTAYRVFNDETNPTRIGTTLFWAVLGVLFVGGSYIPNIINGVLVLIIGVITLFKQVSIGEIKATPEKEVKENANNTGNGIFLPVMTLAISSLLIAQSFPALSQSVLGIGALIGTITLLFTIRRGPKTLLPESDRMIQQVSTTGILPQLLGALGTVFTAAGVGDVVSGLVQGVIPAESRFWGVLVYVLGMVLFTMVMGNAFAAFTVITLGIGVPFVFSLGADPIIAGALAMTAGFCGTLMTPMAGNFNALPVALLEMKSEFGVIKDQVPFAFIMIVVHVILMYYLPFI